MSDPIRTIQERLGIKPTMASGEKTVNSEKTASNEPVKHDADYGGKEQLRELMRRTGRYGR